MSLLGVEMGKRSRHLPEAEADHRLVVLIQNIFGVDRDEAIRLAEESKNLVLGNIRELVDEEEAKATEQIHSIVKAHHPHLTGVESLK